MTYIIDVSIIIPVYYNELSIESTFNLIKTEVITKYSEKKFEIIMIDDGSKDNSFYVMQKIFDLNPDLVRLVKFTRNFGQVPAIYCGYQIARGKYITTISADLQDPPSLICDMINILETTDFDIVCCNRIDREEGFVRKLTSRLFYYLIKKLSFKNMPLGGFDFVSISSRVRDVLLRNKESNPFWQGQILWTGFKIHFIPYVRQKREHGKSKWTFSKKLKYLIDGVLSYSYFPIRVISFCGLLTFLIGIIYSIIIIIQYLLGNYPFQGWTPIMILILLIGGLQLFMLGIIGEYLWRTLDQTRQRELFIIDVIVEKNSK
jgi:dolichol-phosphate mannosyltransferase